MILQGCSTERNQCDSPLLRLPAELRNNIYWFAFESAPAQYRVDSRGIPRFEMVAPSPVLCCRQLYHEWKPFRWEFTDLEIQVSSKDLCYWLASLVSRTCKHKLRFEKVRVLKVDDKVVQAMEMYWYWPHETIHIPDMGPVAYQPELMGAVFPALEIVVLPRVLFDTNTTSEVARRYFNKPHLAVEIGHCERRLRDVE